MSSIVFFDLETTGLNKEIHDVIQIAAVAVDSRFNELETFETKIQFDISKAEPEALLNNSYGQAPHLWNNAPSPQNALNDFAKFCGRYKSIKKISKRTGRPYMVAQLAGHNSEGFDRDFLFAWSKRVAPNIFIPVEWFTLDTMQIASVLRILNNLKQPISENKTIKLGDLCNDYQIPLNNAHDALADVKATVQLAKRLVTNLVGV